jgi:hypothetical protein
MHLELIHTVDYDLYKLEVYSNNHENPQPIIDSINILYDQINSKEYPRGILEIVLPISGVNMIKVFDQTNQLILTSSNIFPEYIEYE